MSFTLGVMALTEAAAKALALIAREAADSADTSHNDLCKWLSDALQDCKPDGCWCYFVDFVGDGESGTVTFAMDGDLTQAPYTITNSDSGIAVKIDMGQCVDVLAMTTYKPEIDEPETEYGAMEAAKLYTPGLIPLVERDITKKMRDKASASSFAGKGKSFPILKAGDVKAALSSIGRAGAGNHPAATLKANPDSPQWPVRQRALEDGKLLFMAVPRLAEPEPFFLLDIGHSPPPGTAWARRLCGRASPACGSICFG